MGDWHFSNWVRLVVFIFLKGAVGHRGKRHRGVPIPLRNLGVLATGGQKPDGFFLELSTISVAVLFTHRLLSTVLSHCPQLRGRPIYLDLP